MIIGIAGGSGSGKTTLANRLAAAYPGEVSVLRHDDYYKARDELTYEERTKLNYDEPDAFDNDLFVKHLEMLRRGEAVECPVYDYTVHNRSSEVRRIEPAKVILVDGILIFTEERICSLFDLKIFVDTDADIRLIRRIRRDMSRRGRTVESVMAQWEQTVKPMHDRYVQPSMAKADVVVPEGRRNLAALELILSRIEKEYGKEAEHDPD